MREKSNSLFYNIDWITVAIYFILILIGWMNIYSAVYDEASSTIFNLSRLESKQFIFILIAIVLAFSIIIIDASFLQQLLMFYLQESFY